MYKMMSNNMCEFHSEAFLKARRNQERRDGPEHVESICQRAHV